MNLHAITEQFGVHADRIRLIKHGGNSHWAVNAPDGRYVLRRFGQHDAINRTLDTCRWEHDLTIDLAAAGYPAIAAISPPREIDGEIYALYPFLRGTIWNPKRTDADYHRLGRLLGEYHAIAETLPPRPQRPAWSLFSEGAYPTQGGAQKREALLERLAGIDADAARAVAAAVDEIEPRLARTEIRALPLLPIHSDFAFWNLALERGALSGVFDFELAHLDSRAADLAFSRRGYHDGVVAGYRESAAISDEEIAALDALWVGSVVRFVWLLLEHEADPPPGDLKWCLEQLSKTRPYRE